MTLYMQTLMGTIISIAIIYSSWRACLCSWVQHLFS